MLFWSAEIILAKSVLKLKDVSGTIVASARLFLGSLFILLFLLFTGQAGMFGAMDLSILGWVVIVGLILAGYNWTFYNGLKYIKASEAAAILTLGLPVTGILCAVFLDQTLTGQELLGIGLIVLSVVAISEVMRESLKLGVIRFFNKERLLQ